jgi:hypothetical protein
MAEAQGDIFTVVMAERGQAWAYTLTGEQLRARLGEGRYTAFLAGESLPVPGQPAHDLCGDGGTLIFRGVPLRPEEMPGGRP